MEIGVYDIVIDTWYIADANLFIDGTYFKFPLQYSYGIAPTKNPKKCIFSLSIIHQYKIRGGVNIFDAKTTHTFSITAIQNENLTPEILFQLVETATLHYGALLQEKSEHTPIYGHVIYAPTIEEHLPNLTKCIEKYLSERN